MTPPDNSSSAGAMEAGRQVARNIAVHDRVARSYEKLHGEIFNGVEQSRLRGTLAAARDAVRTGGNPLCALDFGCGSGNLTSHLLELGLHVTAADVSQSFLDLVAHRHRGRPVETLRLPGGDLSSIADGTFDMVATYSVLHHVPDYLAACAELARICKPGGVILIDHEANEEYWKGSAAYAAFRKAALRFDWRKYLTPSNYYHRVRRVLDPRYSNEGDIHVWPDDHIEWARIRQLMSDKGCEVVMEHDYLLCRQLYRAEVYEQYAGKLSDTKAMIFGKRQAAAG